MVGMDPDNLSAGFLLCTHEVPSHWHKDDYNSMISMDWIKFHRLPEQILSIPTFQQANLLSY